ncbi:cytochrome P450 20A1-like isoform X2 [Tubulanus polymorphus]|uniref:cytochrome P450 20A1-like isoform X2 n=1 Tax=Tubulanus polymorphus TaxID=672921 RepID=UPI003DA2B1A2
MMFSLMIFFAVFIASIIAFVYFYEKEEIKQTTIPGLKPSDPKEGNLADLRKAGSLHEFLLETHKTHGPIISFWMGEKMTVSISSPELFTEQNALFDRPPELFKFVEPMFGVRSIQYANGAEGRLRRKLYDRPYSHHEVSLLYPLFNELAEELTDKWTMLTNDQHIPLRNHMTALALKSITKGSFGDYFNDDEAIKAFGKCYDIVWTEIENTVSATPSKPGSPEEKCYKLAIEQLQSMVAEVIEQRRNNPPTDGAHLLIDVILESSDDEEEITSDASTFMVAGYHTSANSMIWALYFLAMHTDVQDKHFKELSKILDRNVEITPDIIMQMPYLQQVFDETLRCAAVAPWAARVNLDTDSTLGGHEIPKGTPVIQALGVSFRDEKVYPQPHTFDPERFSREQVKTRPPHAFEPFGFAGKRKCPGCKFAQNESYIYIARIIRRFEIKMVPDQVITPVYGLVTYPDKEIWITISERME